MRNATATDKRCPWASVDGPLLLQYHDREWGVPVHNDRKHFEVLVLSGAQAGLNWSLVLKKREGYRRAFDKFDPEKVARYSERKIQGLASNPEIIRNRTIMVMPGRRSFAPRFSYGFSGAADLTRPRGSESALQRRACGCALPRTPAADTRSHRCG
jgi:methyladenine glycosylase